MSRILYGARGLSEPESGDLSNHLVYVISPKAGLRGRLIGQKGKGLSGEILRVKRQEGLLDRGRTQK